MISVIIDAEHPSPNALFFSLHWIHCFVSLDCNKTREKTKIFRLNWSGSTQAIPIDTGHSCYSFGRLSVRLMMTMMLNFNQPHLWTIKNLSMYQTMSLRKKPHDSKWLIDQLAGLPVCSKSNVILMLNCNELNWISKCRRNKNYATKLFTCSKWKNRCGFKYSRSKKKSFLNMFADIRNEPWRMKNTQGSDLVFSSVAFFWPTLMASTCGYGLRFT